jgi:hypothetical protein
MRRGSVPPTVAADASHVEIDEASHVFVREAHKQLARPALACRDAARGVEVLDEGARGVDQLEAAARQRRHRAHGLELAREAVDVDASEERGARSRAVTDEK